MNSHLKANPPDLHKTGTGPGMLWALTIASGTLQDQISPILTDQLAQRCKLPIDTPICASDQVGLLPLMATREIMVTILPNYYSLYLVWHEKEKNAILMSQLNKFLNCKIFSFKLICEPKETMVHEIQESLSLLLGKSRLYNLIYHADLPSGRRQEYFSRAKLLWDEMSHLLTWLFKL